jgi:hypothetical protein
MIFPAERGCKRVLGGPKATQMSMVLLCYTGAALENSSFKICPRSSFTINSGWSFIPIPPSPQKKNDGAVSGLLLATTH